MVLYFVEIDEFVTGTKLYQKTFDKRNMVYQGILNNYRTPRNNRLALFVVDDREILPFKVMFPISTTVAPEGISPKIVEFYLNE